GKNIKGFKVTRIAANSKMATLGLKKNDIIIKANNVVLKSYRDALNIYTKIKDIDLVQIVVIRDGVEKEIVYEIN
ncbi:MAG: PDZ domain-containing protein, partial [Thiovulaceae bacterium]|nr:PDZ domain-containing protein [Sulfurimonadaceae bacterium]